MLKLENSAVEKELKQIMEYQDNVDETVEEENEKPKKGSNSRQSSTGITDEPRCPLCRYVLVARMGRNGPDFFCACYRFEEHGTRP